MDKAIKQLNMRGKGARLARFAMKCKGYEVLTYKHGVMTMIRTGKVPSWESNHNQGE